jgi:hypothetical protein
MNSASVKMVVGGGPNLNMPCKASCIDGAAMDAWAQGGAYQHDGHDDMTSTASVAPKPRAGSLRLKIEH